MEITQKEIEKVSALDSNKRYSYFIKKVCDWETIWVMYNDEFGYALNIDKLDNSYLFVFPNKAFTNLYIENDTDFVDYKATKINLSTFLNELSKKFISKNVNSAFVFPVANGDGVNIKIENLCKDINDEINENY